MLNYQSRTWLEQQYVQEKKSIRQIAQMCNVSHHPPYYWLVKFGIKRRDSSQPKNSKHKEKLKQLLLGYKETKKWKEGMSVALKRRIFSEEHRQKIGEANSRNRKGENHPLWLGGKSFEPYSPEFNDELKRRIRERDGFKCQMPWCGVGENGQKHDIHHIDYDKLNCADENLITLCHSCNTKVNNNRKLWEKIFENIMEFRVDYIPL